VEQGDRDQAAHTQDKAGPEGAGPGKEVHAGKDRVNRLRRVQEIRKRG
jgi:hypothetical protein